MRACYPVVIAAALLIAGCSREKPAEPKAETAKPEPAAKVEPKEETAAKVPDMFKVRFDTSKGPFVIEVHKDWAPKGAERFRELVEDKYFDGARFFRVVPNFVVQFGLAADPAHTKKWDKPISDDPVLRTNALGTVTFATAGPNTRTSQIFINIRSNQMLDQQGFSPFGKVSEGLEVVQKLYSGYGEAPDQGQITSRGNSYLIAQFPNLDYIRKASVIP